MVLSMKRCELKEYLRAQLYHFFPDHYRFEGTDIDTAFELALERVEFCFQHVNVNHYNENGVTKFSHLHADQYAQFLYFFSNSLWRTSENKAICDKIIGLNRVLHSMFFHIKENCLIFFFLCIQ